MASLQGIIILLIIALGLPVMAMETKKDPKMKYMLLGYVCILVASIFAAKMIPGDYGITEMARSVSLMASGLFFGAGAFVSFRRMKRVMQ